MTMAVVLSVFLCAGFAQSKRANPFFCTKQKIFDSFVISPRRGLLTLQKHFHIMNWTKISESEFQLKQGEKLLATMKLKGGKAECRVGERIFQIRRKGFWNNQLELLDASGQVLATLKPASWFGSRWVFRLYDQDYQLLVRNNPLVEYAVQQNGRDVVAYGLKTREGRAIAVISDNRERSLPELDLLLWYLFSPVAQGETGDAETTDIGMILAAA